MNQRQRHAEAHAPALASSNRPALNKACAFAIAADRLAAGGDGGSLPALHAVAGRSRNAEAASTRRRGPIAIVCYFLNEPPDSNISSRSDERTIVLDTPIGRLPFTFQAEDEPESGIGISVWAGGEYQYPLEDRWQLRAGADISRRDYRSGEFDQMTVSGHVGPRWLIDRVTDASLLASVRQHWLSDEAEFRDLGIRVEGRHRLNRRMTASLNASRHERRYDERTHLDGPLTDVSAGVGWVATPTVRIDTAAGWGSQRTERERERNTRRWVRLGVTAHLPWGFTVGGAGTLRGTDYPADWSPFVLGGGPRRDLTRSFRLNVYNRGFTLAGFSPQISLVKEQRTSNAQLHDYKRLYGELRFVRQF